MRIASVFLFLALVLSQPLWVYAKECSKTGSSFTRKCKEKPVPRGNQYLTENDERYPNSLPEDYPELSREELAKIDQEEASLIGEGAMALPELRCEFVLDRARGQRIKVCD